QAQKGQTALWHDIARALSKRTLPAKVSEVRRRAGAGATASSGPTTCSPEPARTRAPPTQVEQFLAAQSEWLAGNLPEGGQPGRAGPVWPAQAAAREAMRNYGKPRQGDRIACYVDTRTGEVEQVAYSLPRAAAATPARAEEEKPAPKPRPDITSQGRGHDRRRCAPDALHQALREAPIADDVLMGLLVLGLGAQNVQVHSGAERKGYGWRERIAGAADRGRRADAGPGRAARGGARDAGRGAVLPREHEPERHERAPRRRGDRCRRLPAEHGDAATS
ncbi:MAG: hypothetical protein WKF40_09860, partial [Thermoleophilaceae bacterium]